MAWTTRFALAVFAGHMVVMFALAQECPGVTAVLHVCVDSARLEANCTVANATLQWQIRPANLEDEFNALIVNTSIGPPADYPTRSLTLESPKCFPFVFENATLLCLANSSGCDAVSANISLSELFLDWCTKDRSPRRQKFNLDYRSRTYSVEIPRRPGQKATLETLPRWTSPPSLAGVSVDVEFGSEILDVVVRDEGDDLITDFSDDHVLLNFSIDAYDPQTKEPVCSFLEQSGTWSTLGCTIATESPDWVQCSCDHLTNFAILMQTTEVPISEVDDRVLGILTKIGLSFSIACLVLTLLVYAICRLKSLRIVIHANLAFALMIGHLMFLFTGTPDKAGCTAVAVLLHFFLLAAFVWMALEGVFLLIKSTPTFSWKIRTAMWFAVGWGFPAIIVLISMAARFSGYQESQTCWLSFAGGFAWAFVAPVIVIIIVNTGVLIRLIYIFMSLQTNKKKSDAQKMKAGLRLVLVLEPLLGLPWLSGLLYFSPSTTFFAYVFVIFNSLQGVFLFVSQCLFDEEVRHKLKSSMAKRSTKVISLTSSSCTQEKSSKDTLVSHETRKQRGSRSVSQAAKSRREEPPIGTLATYDQQIRIREKQDLSEKPEQGEIRAPAFTYLRHGGFHTAGFQFRPPQTMKTPGNDEKFEFVTSEYTADENEGFTKTDRDEISRAQVTSQQVDSPEPEARPITQETHVEENEVISRQMNSSDHEARPSTQDSHIEEKKDASRQTVSPEPDTRPYTPETNIGENEEHREPGVVKECFSVSRGNDRRAARARAISEKQRVPFQTWRY